MVGLFAGFCFLVGKQSKLIELPLRWPTRLWLAYLLAFASRLANKKISLLFLTWLSDSKFASVVGNFVANIGCFSWCSNVGFFVGETVGEIFGIKVGIYALALRLAMKKVSY